MSRDVESLMFEVEETAITLRNEEWMTIVSVLELHRGGRALPIDPERTDLLQKRIFKQLLGPTPEEEAS